MLVLSIFLLCLTTTYAIPAGYTTWFYAQRCPNGWKSPGDYQGRLILSVSNATYGGVKVNSPLLDQEDRTHSHDYSTTATIPERDVAATTCCNDQGACHGDYPVQGTSNTASSGVPFAQLLLCELEADTSGAIPYGTVAYFPPTAKDCPSGWTPYKTANGRFLVPGYSATGIVESQAIPLESGEDRLHSHNFNTNFTTSTVEYVGVVGCCNHNTALTGTYPIKGAMNPTSTGIPYIQLLTCSSIVQTFDHDLPSGALLFNQISCTNGWNVSISAPGRFLVSLPDGAVPGAVYGGKSLNPDYSGPIYHSHDFGGSFDTQACGVGLASGCCAHNYAAHLPYNYHGTTDKAEINIPYLTVPQCIRLFDSMLLEGLRVAQEEYLERTIALVDGLVKWPQL